MDYALILICQFIGIASHVGQTVIALDKLSPDDSMNDVLKLFWKQDRFTVIFSGVIIIFNETAHFATEYYAKEWIESIKYFHLYSFGIALVLGYGGQALFFAILGKSVDFVKEKALSKIQ